MLHLFWDDFFWINLNYVLKRNESNCADPAMDITRSTDKPYLLMLVDCKIDVYINFLRTYLATFQFRIRQAKQGKHCVVGSSLT